MAASSLQKEEGEPAAASSKPDTKPQWLVALAASTQSLVIGCSLTFTMVLIPALQEEENLGLRITLQQGSWLVLSFLTSALVGSFLCGYLGDIFGRKKVLTGTLLGFLVSWILMVASTKMWIMQLSRCIMGLVDGGAFAVTPVYLSEIGDKDLRGSLINLVNVGQSIGMLILIILGWLVPGWRLVGVAVLIIVITSLCLNIFYLPETPYFLVATGKDVLAKKVLQQLRGKDYNIEAEFAEIMRRKAMVDMKKVMKCDETKDKDCLTSTKAAIKTTMATVFSRRFMTPFAVAFPAAVMPQLAGFNSIFMYLVNIFQESGSTVDSYLAAFLVALTRATTGLASSAILKYSPRKPLFLACGMLSALSLCAVGATSFVKALRTEEDPKSTGLVSANFSGRPLISATLPVDAEDGRHDNEVWLDWIPVVALVVTYSCYCFGIDSVVRGLLGEVFPTDVRSLASGVCVVASMTAMNITSFLFPSLLRWVGFPATFWILAGISMVGSIHIFCIMPESKGKSLAALEQFFEDARITSMAVLGGQSGKEVATGNNDEEKASDSVQ